MATQGPTATTYDASTFTNVKGWAGSVQGINAALAAFGWTQVADSNQIDWTNATAAPFGSTVFPNTVLASSATAGGPVSPYLINTRGNWISETLTSVASATGDTSVYTGTITGGGANAFAGFYFTIAGFTNAQNNGVFFCQASTTTTLTLTNYAGTAETHAATASENYNYLDVVRSTVASGGNGNDYILSRTPSVVTNVSVTAGVATITATNNYATGDVIRFKNCIYAYFLNYNSTINNTYTVLASGLSGSSFQINVTGVPFGNQPSSYPSTSEGSATNSVSLSLIVLGSTTRPETDTKNYVAYYYEIWKTADSQTYAETAQTVSYVASTALLTINTNTTPNRLKAGFNITISGATNLPQINGTWCVNSATTTQLTFVIPNSVSGFSGNFSGTDTFTISYTLQPIYMKLEYWNNTGATNAPWIRTAFGTGGDGVGNLTGVRSASDTSAATAIPIGTTGYGAEYSGLTTYSSNPPYDNRMTVTSNASTIWRCIWSGANNRFGTAMFYNRNDTNAVQPQGGSAMWIVERGLDPTGNYLDDYFTVIFGGSTSTQTNATVPVYTRYYLKPNPSVSITQVQVDGSNNVTVTYSTNQGFSFQIGAIVYFQNLQTATFLNNQIIRVTGVTGSTITGVIAAHAAYGPAPDTGNMIQSVSLTSLTPISGTGNYTWVDYTVPTVRTNVTTTLVINGYTPLFPVMPIPGYVGNPMTMAMTTNSVDSGAHDTTTTITLYGATRTYYQPQGQGSGAQQSQIPYAYFGNGNQGDMAMFLRWD